MIDGLVPCRRRKRDVSKTDVIYTQQYGHVMSLFRRYRRVAPYPVLHQPNVSYNIPNFIATRPASHSLWLGEISLQNNPSEQSYEDVQGTLQALWVPRAKYSIVSVEHTQTPDHHMSQSGITTDL